METHQSNNRYILKSYKHSIECNNNHCHYPLCRKIRTCRYSQRNITQNQVAHNPINYKQFNEMGSSSYTDYKLNIPGPNTQNKTFNLEPPIIRKNPQSNVNSMIGMPIDNYNTQPQPQYNLPYNNQMNPVPSPNSSYSSINSNSIASNKYTRIPTPSYPVTSDKTKYIQQNHNITKKVYPISMQNNINNKIYGSTANVYLFIIVSNFIINKINIWYI